MAGLLDLLLGSSQTPSPNATVPTDQSVPPDLVVTARRPMAMKGQPNTQDSQPAPPPPPSAPPSTAQMSVPPNLDYNNTADVAALQQATAADKAAPGGYGASPGIYGLLPQGLQHGTLRSVLGSLGDAMLMGSGHQPLYQENQQRLQEGNAMAGYDQNPQAAIQRIAATGVPGSTDLAAKLEEQRQTMEYNQQYKQMMIHNQQQNTIDRLTPMAAGLVHGVTDAQTYATRYSQADAMAKRIDPTMDASTAFGIPIPEQWTPDSTVAAGMSGNQQAVDAAKGNERGVQVRGQDVAAGSRIGAARIGASGRTTDANISANRPSPTTYLQSLIEKQKQGQPLSSAEQNYIVRSTQPTGHGGRPSLIGVPGGNPNANIPSGAISMLKTNPSLRSQFDAKYGQGASARILGQ